MCMAKKGAIFLYKNVAPLLAKFRVVEDLNGIGAENVPREGGIRGGSCTETSLENAGENCGGKLLPNCSIRDLVRVTNCAEK